MTPKSEGIGLIEACQFTYKYAGNLETNTWFAEVFKDITTLVSKIEESTSIKELSKIRDIVDRVKRSSPVKRVVDEATEILYNVDDKIFILTE